MDNNGDSFIDKARCGNCENYKDKFCKLRTKEVEENLSGCSMFKESEDQTPLDKVHETIRKWCFIKNMNRVDLMLAVHLTRLKKGTKLWLIIIGRSGDLKSELLRTLDDNGETTYVLEEMTANTLVSGNPCSKDLAPELNNKTILIPDFAILLNLKHDEKGKIWAQLRELYDGNARKVTGSPKGNKYYKELNVTLIGCSTPVIDNQILIHQDLGTRELLYRLKGVEKKTEKEKLMEKVLENETYEIEMRNELKSVIQKFLKNIKYEDIEINKKCLDKIKEYVSYLTVMRTSAQVDSYSGDLISTAEPEQPTRILKQFVILFKGLKSLDKNYSDKKALEIIKEVRDSSCNVDRVKIFKCFCKDSDVNHSYSEISQKVRLGKSTVKRHCSVLWNLKLIDRNVLELGNDKQSYTWTVNKDNLITKIVMEEVNISIKNEVVK